ncbi:hypothetical protein [Aeromicrobium sp. Root495]|nr:hypothetical protein [Aeromicrobium sp. Root495]
MSEPAPEPDTGPSAPVDPVQEGAPATGPEAPVPPTGPTKDEGGSDG